MNRTIKAVLVAGALLLSAGSPTLAGGGGGTVGGADEFRRPQLAAVQGGKIGAGMDRNGDEDLPDTSAVQKVREA